MPEAAKPYERAEVDMRARLYDAKKPFGRKARFAVVPIEVVRTQNIRTSDDVAEAQKQVDVDMLGALEEMVNAARAGRLEGEALSLAALAW